MEVVGWAVLIILICFFVQVAHEVTGLIAKWKPHRSKDW